MWGSVGPNLALKGVKCPSLSLRKREEGRGFVCLGKKEEEEEEEVKVPQEGRIVTGERNYSRLFAARGRRGGGITVGGKKNILELNIHVKRKRERERVDMKMKLRYSNCLELS